MTTTGPAPQDTRPAAALSTDPSSQYGSQFVDRWDDLIDWERRQAGEGNFFTDTLHRAGVHTVLDVAAGTGYHSVALARSGFRVTAGDASPEMVARAAANLRAHGQQVPTLVADWRTIGASLPGQKFDAVVCLGSSFPHLFDETDRRIALEQFAALLEPGGLLIVDHRNFDAIRAHRYASSGRYYYCGRGTQVTIDHIDAELCRFRYDFADRGSYTLEVYPVLAQEMTDLLGQAGFESVERFGDFESGRELMDSDFVIHVARSRGRGPA
jgi:glycine/sarcosine N-methyltransferase